MKLHNEGKLEEAIRVQQIRRFFFSERIIELRRRTGMNQKDFGALFRVSGPMVSRWEGGTSVPRDRVFLLMAEVAERIGWKWES